MGCGVCTHAKRIVSSAPSGPGKAEIAVLTRDVDRRFFEKDAPRCIATNSRRSGISPKFKGIPNVVTSISKDKGGQYIGVQLSPGIAGYYAAFLDGLIDVKLRIPAEYATRQARNPVWDPLWNTDRFGPYCVASLAR